MSRKRVSRRNPFSVRYSTDLVLVGLRQKTNREKPQPQSLLGIYFEKPKIAETQIDQGKS